MHGYEWNDAASSNLVDLGQHSFCAIGYIRHDGANGGWCNVYFEGNSWKLDYGKWAKGGIQCMANCF